MANTTSKAKAAKSAKAKTQHEGRVTVSLGATINIGDFEFVRIDIGVQEPFLPATPKERDATYKQTLDWVKTKIKEEITKIKAGQGTKFTGE